MYRCTVYCIYYDYKRGFTFLSRYEWVLIKQSSLSRKVYYQITGPVAKLENCGFVYFVRNTGLVKKNLTQKLTSDQALEKLE